MMIGVSMATAMVICVAAFIWLYVQIGPLFSDFVSQQPAAGDEPSETIGVIGETEEPTPSPVSPFFEELVQDDQLFEPEIPDPTPVATEDDDSEVAELDDGHAPEADDFDESVDEQENTEEDEETWEATHQIREGPNVNFRSGPNTISQTQGALSPGTSLRFLDEEEPAGGVTWMFFDLEDGTEGWIRDIDVVEVDTADDLDDDEEADDE